MSLHQNLATEVQAVGEIDLDKMKRYISYCKTCVGLDSQVATDALYSRCAPKLSTEAAEKLSSHFVALRKQIQQVERDNNERSSIPITVR
jgi:DNA replication licensing factor MCM5